MATAPTPIGDIGAYRPHVIKQGDTFGPFTLTIYAPPVAPATVATVVADLSNKTFAAQLRRKGLDTAVVATFSISVPNAALGQCVYSLPANVTGAIPCGETLTDALSQFTWDLDMTDTVTGEVRTLLHGPVQVYRGVTRP